VAIDLDDGTDLSPFSTLEGFLALHLQWVHTAGHKGAVPLVQHPGRYRRLPQEHFDGQPH
jgi:hypothetical protein